jgi:hypothetical protein
MLVELVHEMNTDDRVDTEFDEWRRGINVARRKLEHALKQREDPIPDRLPT